MSENFTIELLPDSIKGDAIIADPSQCVVTIETNDDAQGVLAIDFTNTESDADKENYFLVNEDSENP